MKKAQVILGVRIQSEAAEQRLLHLLECRKGDYEDFILIEEEFESADDLLSLVH